MTDAAHLFSDVSGFFISIISIYLGSVKASSKMSYGYLRAEIIGALCSVLIIWGLTVFLIIEAIERIIHPPEVEADIMLLVSCVGFLFNLIMFKILHTTHLPGIGGHNCGHDHGGGHGHSHAHGGSEQHDLEHSPI